MQQKIRDTLKEQYTRDLRKQVVKSMLKNEKTKSDVNNLLKSEELKNILDSSFEVLHYDEFKNEDYEIYKMKKQVIVAKK